MATPLQFDPASLQVPVVSGLAAGVGSLMTEAGSDVADIFGVNIPVPVYYALTVGVASFAVIANSSYLLPWIGVTDPTTYNALYFATPFVTGISVIAIDSVINLINGNGIADSGTMVTLFIVGAIAGVIGQWSANMSSSNKTGY